MYLKHSDLFIVNKNGGVFPELPEDVKGTIKRLEFNSFFFKKKADY